MKQIKNISVITAVFFIDVRCIKCHDASRKVYSSLSKVMEIVQWYHNPAAVLLTQCVLE